MLTRLIYASEAAEALTPATVQSIVDHARSANARNDITGMLAFNSNWFLQTLEGRREAVSETFCRIAADKRHRRVIVMDALPINERLFSDWSMGFAAANEQGVEKFRRFSGTGHFDPSAMSAASALGLLRAFAVH